MANKGNRFRGFTIIELMVVLAVVSILAVIAMPIYISYATRSQVSEGMVFAAEARTAVAEYFSDTNTMPQNNSQSGLKEPDDYNSLDYVSRLAVGNDPHPGSITVAFKIPSLGTNNRLQLVPATVNNRLTWTCTSAATNGMEPRFLPPNCRG